MLHCGHVSTSSKYVTRMNHVADNVADFPLAVAIIRVLQNGNAPLAPYPFAVFGSFRISHASVCASIYLSSKPQESSTACSKPVRSEEAVDCTESFSNNSSERMSVHEIGQ